MATLRPFRALRPPRELVEAVAAPPYDVVDTAEAAALAAGNPDSFLHVSRPEIDLPDGDPHSDAAYAQARAALTDAARRGVLVERPDALLVYRQEMTIELGGRSVVAAQTGVVGCVSAADYRAGRIATHEFTRPDKEDDRTRHIAVLGAHDEPVMLMYRSDQAGAAAVAEVIQGVTRAEPEYAFSADGVRHTLWEVTDAEVVARVVDAVASIDTLYVADGHHRCAAAARVAEESEAPEAAFFPATVLAADQLTVLAYHRVVADRAGLSVPELLGALEEAFTVEAVDTAPDPARHQVGVYTDGHWFLLTARDGVVDESDPIARLDVAVLAERVLGPVLGITDQRTDARITFVGGIRGTGELERRVNALADGVAFALPATSTADVMDVADLGEVMPPKSTWFEPKLRSGLFVHPFA
ncbi:DUF1015 family protein [Isoptericola sp. b490]|uniref:DUF1015 domain-containing protein n=1 Tax=Actinotalea lenta TaxID=3064654 RepID=UPI002713D27C|nr:DUF1015 family protein [Isoptericola sp. b490]MDO8120827.1 DUF1015 family protein [Isoptericola sp. b490]